MNVQPQKLTQVLEGPAPRTRRYSDIPKEVETFFRVNTGQVLTLAAAHPTEMATLHSTGRVPVHYRELDERLLSILRAHGFMVNETDGTIRKMDCCLYRQGEEERDYWRNVQMVERLRREDPDALRDAIEQSAKEAERHGGHRGIVRVAERRTPSVSDFVYHDSNMHDEED